MKLNKLAVAVLALSGVTGAHAAEVYNQNGTKLDLYGKVVGEHYFSSDKSAEGDQSYARLGFKGVTQISDSLAGYGQWEYNLPANNTESVGTSDNSRTRLAFAGIKHDELGSFDYGRNYGVLYDIEGMTDMLPEFGGDTSAQLDNYMTSRANGVATWRNTDLAGLVHGLNVALQYQGKNGSADGEGITNNGRDVRHQNGDGYGVSALYDLGQGFGLGAAYTSSDRTSEQKSRAGGQYASGNKAQAWATGAKFDADNLYVAGTYSETLNMTPFGTTDSVAGGGIANKTRNVEMVAQYQLASGFRPSIAYLESRGHALNSAYGDDKPLVKYIDLGGTYYFNKNMSTYVDYKINLLDGNDDFYRDNGIGTDNIVATGLVYQF
ncbi:porin OmpC [Enterobacter hormaechei]|uniref:porin OmpC n=1 Tax=Enterobacter hormaechei TaxID=158836 RepID=UPI0032DBC84B